LRTHCWIPGTNWKVAGAAGDRVIVDAVGAAVDAEVAEVAVGAEVAAGAEVAVGTEAAEVAFDAEVAVGVEVGVDAEVGVEVVVVGFAVAVADEQVVVEIYAELAAVVVPVGSSSLSHKERCWVVVASCMTVIRDEAVSVYLVPLQTEHMEDNTVELRGHSLSLEPQLHYSKLADPGVVGA